MAELKPCRCGGSAHLNKTSKGKFWFECCCCWHNSRKFWSVEEAADDWNRECEKQEDTDG